MHGEECQVAFEKQQVLNNYNSVRMVSNQVFPVLPVCSISFSEDK